MSLRGLRFMISFSLTEGGIICRTVFNISRVVVGGSLFSIYRFVMVNGGVLAMSGLDWIVQEQIFSSTRESALPKQVWETGWFKQILATGWHPAQRGTPQKRQIGTPKSLFSDSNRNTTNASNTNTPRNHPGKHPFLARIIRSMAVHTLHMSKPVITFVFKVLRNGLLRYILYTCPNL